jgi:DNA-binding transcriptional regulator GbsR (MarR family)
MKSNPWGGGSSPSIQNNTDLPDWEHDVIESIGRVIGFWGFKENHGRIWSCLYLNGPTTSKDLRQKLGISKGGMSMLLADLENWNIIERTQHSSDSNTITEYPETPRDRNARVYVAKKDFSSMIVRVLQIREQGLISSTLHSLEQAQAQAQTQTQTQNVTEDQKHSLQNMINFAQGLHQVFDFICSNEASIVQIQHFMSMTHTSHQKQNIQE